MQTLNSSRRSFMKWVAAAPLLSQIAVSDLYAKAASAVGRDLRQNVYTRLGIKTVINCRGTWTYLSGSLEFPEVREAMIEAGQYFVNVLDLQHAIGRRLAELTGAEFGMITSGAAGAMAVATAGSMAGTDDKLIWQLPDTTGLKNEVVMSGGRSAFDSAIRLTGAKLVLAYSPEELANAINQNTTLIYTTHLGDELQKELAIAKDHKVPLLLDDAAGIPPADNAKLYARMGIDLYTFSGGKGLRGPQCSGVLLGRKDLIDAATHNNSPNSDTVGRGMKVSKEQIVGMVAAVDWFLSQTDASLEAEFRRRADKIAAQLKSIPTLESRVVIPNVAANAVPHLLLRYDTQRIKIRPVDVMAELRKGTPSIELNPQTGRKPGSGLPSDESTIVVGVWMLEPGEEVIVARRIKEILEKAV